MNPTKPRPWDFWSEESSLTGLLIFTLAYLFFICALGDFNFGAVVGRLLFSFIIVTGVMTTFRQRWLSFLVILIALAGLALSWLEYLHQEWSLTILNAVVGLLVLAFLLTTLMVQVFRGGRVTAHRIRGAIVVYLLLGGLWSFLYFIVALTIPGAFHWPDGLATDNWEAVQQALTYFSFVTLTTTGFGDITPALPLTRTLAMFEALAGQLYLVITLARLVSLAVVSPGLRQKQEE
jgi:hypothetical protein